jgi:phosphoribosylaminoimidazole carboxylase
MRKQRKMGHITIVGSSLSNLESNLATIIEEKASDDKTAGY